MKKYATLIKKGKLRAIGNINMKNPLNKLFGYEETYQFQFDGGFDVHNKIGEFAISRYFVGLVPHYYVDLGNHGIMGKGWKETLVRAIEPMMVGYIKYILLKDKIRAERYEMESRCKPCEPPVKLERVPNYEKYR